MSVRLSIGTYLKSIKVDFENLNYLILFPFYLVDLVRFLKKNQYSYFPAIINDGLPIHHLQTSES